MKSAVLALSLILSSSAFANLISGSTLETEHQLVISKAIEVQCVIPYTALRQVGESIATPLKVDNGITDIQYVTTIQSREYTVVVHSLYSDMQNVGDDSKYSVTKIDSDYCKH
ncbi:MAG: hypothetical protein EOP04_08985 [Proteobacteria bacterium]|nr:MAG: hypothetical protein EOP04_08985 [Pseudomonadota bacterium]